MNSRDLNWFWDELAACAGDLPQLLELVARRVTEVVGEACVLTVVSDDGRSLNPVAVNHVDESTRAEMAGLLKGASIPIGEGTVGMVAADREAVVLSDLDQTDVPRMVTDVTRPFLEHHRIRSFMIVPLVASGEVVGTLGAMRTTSPEPYTDGELVVLESLAERAALAIADARHGVHSLGLSDYEAIFRHSLDGVLFTVPDGRILAANPAACEILGRTEVEICRGGRMDLLDHDDPDTKRLLLRRAVSGRTRGEVPMRRGDGSRFTAELSSTIFANERGELRSVVIFRDVTQQVDLRRQLQRQRVRLERLSKEDSLTGLLNRRGFEVAAEHVLAFARREHASVRLVYFDIDGLKAINDQFGHQVGDQAIKRLATALADTVREVDLAARLSGDEFVLLLYDVDAAGAAHVIERVGAAIAQASDDGPPVAFSAGVAEQSTDSPQTLDELMEAADRRMYQQKVLRRVEANRSADPSG